MLKLSMADAWMLYRVTFFPGVVRKKIEKVLDSPGITDLGREVASILLFGDSGDCSDRAMCIARLYSDHSQGANVRVRVN